VALKAAEVAVAIVETLPDALCVSSLGTATSAVRSASGDGPHFYLGAAMGSALAAAMGVAEALADRLVVAVLGDGELLMGASTLWSVSAYRPGNLITVVLSDGVYGITGGQQLSASPRFAAVAQAMGGIAGLSVGSELELRHAMRELERPSLIEVELTERAWPGPSPFVDPAQVRLAFAARVARSIGPESDSAQTTRQ
jgi:thiamine pyrophosphate-dependent acetolactate synthase large subunit-like protein